MNKRLIILPFLLISSWCFGQFINDFSGSIESFGQYLIDDDKIGSSSEVRFRSNNYFDFRYVKNNFSANIQFESYVEERVLGYSPVYDQKIGLTYLSLTYSFKKIEATIGSFHDQFGSGLIFRSWEDRALGLNNSLFGANIKYNPHEKVEITFIAGKQRNGFELSDGSLFGLDLNYQMTKKFNFAFSYVNRYQKIEDNPLEIPNYTNLYSGRINYFGKNMYSNLELIFKGKDALVEFGNVIESRMFTGNALLFNLGYFKKGFGFDATFRRLENMAMYTDREFYANIYNELVVNYIPALTKQHSLSLSNIYVYPAQPRLNFLPPGKAGEIGQQIDLFYNFSDHNSALGRFKTEIALNYASWYGLDAVFDFDNRAYTAKYFSYGTRYYTDLNLEIKNEWSDKWSTILTWIHQFYNRQYLESITGSVKADIVAIDLHYKIAKSKKLHFQVEHLWNTDDKKNWIAFLSEFQFHKKFSIYISDMYNYGNDQEIERIHYYNLGMSYKNKKTRFNLNYGRQRGGLLCVGGVCRFVPNSNGLSFGMNIFI